MNTPDTIKIYFDQQNFETGVHRGSTWVKICVLTLRDAPDKYAFKIVGPNPISALNVVDLSDIANIIDGNIVSFKRFTDGRSLYRVSATADIPCELAPIIEFADVRITISAFDTLYEFKIPEATNVQGILQLIDNGYMQFTKVI